MCGCGLFGKMRESMRQSFNGCSNKDLYGSIQNDVDVSFSAEDDATPSIRQSAKKCLLLGTCQAVSHGIALVSGVALVLLFQNLGSVVALLGSDDGTFPNNGTNFPSSGM
jgi:hypothetical protein